MSGYADRPWLARYLPGMPADIDIPFASGLEMFEAAVAGGADRPLIHYFGRTITVGEADRAADALAAGMVAGGLRPGDRVAIDLQNMPQFILAVIAAWKVGCVVVTINPMNKERELTYVLQDSGATVLVTLQSLYGEVAKNVIADTDVRLVITTSELDYAVDIPPLLKVSQRQTFDATTDFVELVAAHDGERVDRPDLGPSDVAFLAYTSGTTGPPKGAMNTHQNVVFNAAVYRRWMSLTPDDVVLGVAPLFHITGLIAHLAVALLVPMPVVLAYRFDPVTVLDAIERYRPTFTVGAITVFIALMNDPSCAERDLTSLTKVYSGGAPIAPSVVERFEREIGPYIHNIYGLTETTSPSHGVPMGERAPVDPTSGALSVGVPVFNTVVRVVDDDGNDVAPGEIGEFVTAGPQIVAGYWNKPEETAHALPGGELHTGDVGFMDADGWYYVVDRKKDMIIASGYKVWPREVEDVLYQHPAVREAAVIGIPDEYRGETVKAFVSLRPGESATEADLIAFCKERMSAYKYPRSVELVEELPKTVTGKILRRELRQPG
ncbi:MAG: fadD 7 [Ilumatobacteraceae bacterium]|jgi:long-chain acyl-CoA synthetase|nr:fadD 7 [Ilumatobacteraceae bacterium]